MTTNRRKRAIAATLSLVMVLSMAALGMAAFAGSAAAQTNVSDGEVLIASNPADSTETSADHVVTINATSAIAGDGSFGGTNTQIEINYTTSGGPIGSPDAAVDYISADGSTINNIDDGTITDASGGSNRNVSISDGSLNTLGPTLNEGDKIRVALTGEQIDNSGFNADDITVEVTNSSSNTATYKAVDGEVSTPLDNSAPIALEGTNANYTSFEQAVGDSTGDNVVVSSTVNESNTQPTALSGGLSTASSSNDFDITNASGTSPVVEFDTGGGTLLDVSGGINTVENIEFQADDGLSATDQSDKGIAGVDDDTIDGNTFNGFDNYAIDSAGGGVNDATISNNVINADTGDNIDAIRIQDTAGSSNEVRGNTINDVSDGAGVLVGGMSSHQLNISNNDINDVGSAGNGVSVSGSADGASLKLNNTNNIDTSGATTAVSIAISEDPTLVINDTVITGDATADDTGILIDKGDSTDSDNFTPVIGGTNTDVSEANTSVDLQFSDTASGGDHTVTIEDGTFTANGDGGSSTAITATEDASGLTSLTVTVRDVTINGDADTTGVNLNDGATDLNLDNNYGEASTFDGAGTAVSVAAVNNFGDVSNTTFTNISTTAIDVQDNPGSALTLEDITVNGQSSDGATAVTFNDGGNNALTVVDSKLGESSSEEVNDGVDVQAANGEVTVNSTEIWVDGGNGINLASSNGNTLTVDGTTIAGSDQTGTGLRVADSTTGTLNVNPDNSGTIQGLDVGIDIQNANALTLGSGVDIDNYGSTGINHAVDADLTLSGVELTEDSSGGATGVAYTAGTSVLTIDSQSLIQVADDSSSIGVQLDNDGTQFDITKSTIEAVGTQSAGTGIDINNAADSPVGTTANIQLNDIVGFNKSNANGLAGSEVDNLMDGNATGNWWGSEYGPDASAGSSVSSSVSNDAYDPFLTADLSTQVNNAEDADSVSALTTSDVQEFAHGLTVGEGESFAFPATSTDTQISDLYTDNSSNVAIYEFNASSQSWELASDRPTGLDAYVASFGDDGDSINVKIEYESQSSGVDRGTYEYQQGFNYLPVAQENTGVGTSVISDTSGFDLADPSNQETRFASQYSGAANDIYSQSSYATVRGDNLGSPSPDLSPFQGTFVYVNTTVTDDQIAPLDPSVNLDNADNIDEQPS
jgi:hypothetical protein